jgi:hypothetical protein
MGRTQGIGMEGSSYYFLSGRDNTPKRKWDYPKPKQGFIMRYKEGKVIRSTLLRVVGIIHLKGSEITLNLNKGSSWGTKKGRWLDLLY